MKVRIAGTGIATAIAVAATALTAAPAFAGTISVGETLDDGGGARKK